MAEPDTDLAREVRELREMVEALRGQLAAPPRVTLRALQSRPFLGQPVNLVATAAGAGGAPSAGAPLTLTTTWGRLRGVSGSEIVEASNLAVRTGADGTVRVLLVPPAPEGLTPRQQDTLESALLTLDPTAATPEATMPGLQEIARQYRAESNAELRRAIDLYFLDLGADLQEVSPLSGGEPWRFIDATALAFLRDGTVEDADVFDTAVLATAALPLRFTDWRRPWMQAVLALAADASSLDAELAAERRPRVSADVLLTQVYGRVRDFVTDQKGKVGELVGRRIAEKSLRTFAESGRDVLSPETHVSIVSAIDVAAGTLAAGSQIFAAVGQTRRDLTRTVDRKIAEVPKVDLSGLNLRIDQLDSKVATKADTAILAGFQTEVTSRLDARLDARLETALAGKADRAAVDAIRVSLTEEIGGLKASTGKLADEIIRLDSRTTKLGADVTVLGSDLTLKIDAKADRRTVDAINADLVREIGVIKGQTAQLDQKVVLLDTSVTRIDTSVIHLNTSVTRLDTSVNKIDNDLGTIRIRPDVFRPGG
jgi:hypothetical protein